MQLLCVPMQFAFKPHSFLSEVEMLLILPSHPPVFSVFHSDIFSLNRALDLFSWIIPGRKLLKTPIKIR